MPAYGPSSGVPFPGYISGNWYAPYLSGAPAAGAAGANTVLTLVLHYFPQTTAISALGTKISTAFAGNAMLGIYAHNPSTGKPTGNVLASVAGLSTAAAANVSAALGANVVLPPGFYWGASEMDNATAAFITPTPTGFGMTNIVGSSTFGNVTFGGTLGWQVNNTYGSFPDLTSASLTEVGPIKGASIFHRAV
jgi:hypothetical protein